MAPVAVSYLRMDEDGTLSMTHAALLVLPSELLEEILLSPSLSLPDLCRVRQVCWHLRHVVDRLWTKVASSRSERSRGVSHNLRIYIRWRGWGSISGSTHQEWYSLCRQRFLCEEQLSVVLDHLSRRGYKVDGFTQHHPSLPPPPPPPPPPSAILCTLCLCVASIHR